TWQNERDRFVMCVDQKQKRFVPNRFALKTQNIGRIAAQQHSHTTNEWRRPFFVAHLVSARVEPHDIAGFRSAYPPALEKLRTSKYRVDITKRDELSGKLQKLNLLLVVAPIKPTNLVVLAISVVITALRSSPLVSAIQHRHALRKKKRS